MYSFILIILFLLITFILFLASINLIYIKRAKRINKKLEDINTLYTIKYKDFIIINPFDTNGTYHKAQLHTHSRNSDGKLSIKDLINIYKEKNYSFLAITDHDKISKFNLDDNNFLLISG